MEHRLSPRESRRLVRQFLRLDRRAPAVVLFAGSTPPRDEPPPLQRPAHHAGPYEVDDITDSGYVIERTIIVP